MSIKKNIKENQQEQMFARRGAELRRVMVERDLDIVMVCASEEDFAYAFALTGRRPILHHYFFVARRRVLQHLAGAAERDVIGWTDGASDDWVEGYFAPEFLLERLFLPANTLRIFCDENKMSRAMSGFLRGARRVGVLGPAPAVDFARSRAELVFLNDVLWPVLLGKSVEELEGIKNVGDLLEKVIHEIEPILKQGVRFTAVMEDLDRRILSEADALAFPSLLGRSESKKKWFSLWPGRAKIRHRDVLYINIGAQKDGFFADVGRTFVLHDAVLAQTWRDIEKVYLRWIKSLRPTDKLIDLQSSLETVFSEAGLNNVRLRAEGLGHAIGFGLIHLPYIQNKLFPDQHLGQNTSWSLILSCEVNGHRLQRQDMVFIGAPVSK